MEYFDFGEKLITAIFVFITGVSFGSFFNVVIDRLPRGKTLSGRSRCDYCRRVLSWFDLIPLVSFLVLKGRCRYCSKMLSWQYFAVEFTTGVLFLAVYVYVSVFFDASFYKFIYLATVFSLLFVIFITDLKYRLILDQYILILVFVAYLDIFLFSPQILLENSLVGFASFAFFLFLHLITKGKGMGFGDVKYAFFMGLFLGFPDVLVAFYVSFLTGSTVSLILVLAGTKRMKDTVAFGPFLVVGTVCGFFFADLILNWYGRLFY